MSVAVDSEMPSNVGQARFHDANLTYAFTNTAGTKLIVAASVADGAGGQTVSAVTYAGVSMTKYNEKLSNGVAKAHCTLWYLDSPATGSNNVVVTISGTVTGNGEVISGAVSLTGAATGSLIHDTSKSTSGVSTDNMDVVSTTVGNLVLMMATAGGDFTGTQTQTLSWLLNVDGNTAGDNAQLRRAAGSGGTVNFQVSLSGADTITMLAAEVPASGSGTTLTPAQGAMAFTGRGTSLGFAINMPDEP